MSTWAKDLEKFEDQMGSEIDERMEATASAIYSEIVIQSPMWTGAYLDSHRIGLNGKSPERGSKLDVGFQHPFPPHISDADVPALMLRVKSQALKLKNKKGLSKIVFSNASSHDEAVEIEHGYFIYARAEEIGRLVSNGQIDYSKYYSTPLEIDQPDEDEGYTDLDELI